MGGTATRELFYIAQDGLPGGVGQAAILRQPDTYTPAAWLSRGLCDVVVVPLLNPGIIQRVQEGQAPEEEHNPWAHCMVMWGNLLYEASQMYAAGGAQDWKDSLDAAVEKFRAAGCPEPDIQAALRNHTEAEKLDLPPVKASTSPDNNEYSLGPQMAFTIKKLSGPHLAARGNYSEVIMLD